MSLYQFYSYLYEIPNVEKIFSGKADDNKKSEASNMTNEEVVERAKKSGFMTPKKY